MSELASLLRLAPATSQLPVSWYLDERTFELEKKLLFADAPGYGGHALMVPNAGDYYTLEWADHGKMLVHNAKGVELMVNACRHRQAIIVEGKGNARNLVCPLHRWTYDMEGTLLGAPHFAENPCRNLFKTPLSNWNAFIEIYLELYHVIPFHPGLAGFVACDDLRWTVGEEYSVQVLGPNHHLEKPGTPVYHKWHERGKRYVGEKDPEHGAIWQLYYPNVMLEWYPNTIVISTLIPVSPTRTLNVVEYYYTEEVALFEREYVEAQQAAYAETAD